MELIKYLHEHYRGKKVFLTGHTGFKGAWMLLVLHQLGASVKGYSLPPEKDTLYTAIGGDAICDSLYADIRDYNLLAKTLLDFPPDYVFHMAAQPLVLESYADPLGTFSVNAMGTANILQALRELKKTCQAVIITTDKVYEQTGDNKIFSEEDKLGGHDPYSASKACCELIVQSFHKSFFNGGASRVSVASARSGNVIGGGDWAENRIVPDLIRSILRNEPLTLRNPMSVRPWQHVLDALIGYLMLGAELQNKINDISLSWNFAPLVTEDIPVEKVVQKIFSILRSGRYEKPSSSDTPHEASFLQLNANLAHEKLGWTPKLAPFSAIEWTSNWYSDVTFNHHDARAVTLSQIQKYFSL